MQRIRGVVRTCWLALALSLALLTAASTRAEEAPLGRPDARERTPADVVSTVTRSELPRLPKGFVQERIGSVLWAYPKRDVELARALQGKLGASWRKVVTELGRDVSSEMTVRIAQSPAEMKLLAPRGNPPPAYAVGVAYPALGLIILSVVSPESWLAPDLDAILTHELSHIALYRAVEGRALPLWFVEGLAADQAGEHRLARVRTLWEAAVTGSILPLELVSHSFPDRPQAVNLAYAQSADLVRHMLQNPTDRGRLPRLLARVAGGAPFEQAVLATYRTDLEYLDREWRHGLSERFRVLPLVLTGTALWGGIALLAVVAFIRRRAQQREKLARWAEEEQAEEERAESERERALAALPTSPMSTPPREARVLHVYALPPVVREAGVPTVEHEGQRHTLH